jgi:sugar/nucleoside kinase (ribokinase family)
MEDLERLQESFNGKPRSEACELDCGPASLFLRCLFPAAIMDFKATTLAELRSKRAALSSLRAFVGFDGFVDTIVTPVGLRTGAGENFTPLSTIPEFGARVLGAAGKSTNIELYPRMEKLGGNGPIMANALLAAGTKITYVGALGKALIHPVFQDLSRSAHVISLCDPATTLAIEFGDGKLMLGQMRSLDDITLEKIIETTGEASLHETLASASLIALVNWTMIPSMSAIFEGLLENVLPALSGHDRLFFFDLADPEKRSLADLVEALDLISRFEKFGRVTLGLNLKEAQQVSVALGFAPTEANDESAVRQIATDVRRKLGVAMVVIHPRESAACATADGSAWVPGPYIAKPLVTTGAGDHFNAGFSIGQLLGFSPTACLGMGVCTSGYYVRTGFSPSLDDLETFLANWK